MDQEIHGVEASQALFNYFGISEDGDKAFFEHTIPGEMQGYHDSWRMGRCFRRQSKDLRLVLSQYSSLKMRYH